MLVLATRADEDGTVVLMAREAPKVLPGAIAETKAAIPAVSAAAPPMATRRVSPTR